MPEAGTNSYLRDPTEERVAVILSLDTALLAELQVCRPSHPPKLTPCQLQKSAEPEYETNVLCLLRQYVCRLRRCHALK